MLKGKGDLLAMLAGTLLIGLSGYVFLVIIGHGRFDPATTAALSATFLLGNVLGPGVFVAVEQETSRVVSDAIARGLTVGSRARRLAAVDGGLALATLLVLTAFAPLLLSRVLDGQVDLIVALALAVVGSAAVYLVRGLTGGQRRFRRYATTVVIDGATRIAGCVLLVAVGSTDPVAYGLALCAGPAVAAVLTGQFRRALSSPSSAPVGAAKLGRAIEAGSDVGGPPRMSRLTRDVGLLLIASALAMVLANLAPVVLTAMLPGDPVTAAGFAGAVVLTRVPLLFMGPIQALLLPGMTAAAATDDRARLRSTVTRGLAAITGIGIVAVIGAAIFGRPAIALLLGGDRDTTDSGSLVWLSASAAVFMAVLLLQPALVALRRHRALVLAWVAGAIAFAGAFVVPLPPVDQAVLAQIVGPVVTLLAQLTVLIGRPGKKPAPSISAY